MLGWYFIVYPERLRRLGDQLPKAARLATWRAGLGGTEWLDELCAQGRAIDLGGNGYPNRYALPAHALVAILRQGIPPHAGPAVIGDDYVLPPGWIADANVNLSELEQLDSDEMLAVEAWDQS